MVATADPDVVKADDDVREADLTSDTALPGAVLRVLTAGRLALREQRDREAAERRAKQDAEDNLWAGCFTGLPAAVRQIVPADLLPYVEYREAEERATYFNADGVRDGGGYWLTPNWTNTQVELRCPGCETVSIPLHRSYSGETTAAVAAGWTPWQQWSGFHAHPWDAEHNRLGQSVAYPTLALALAVAREAWLARQQHEREVPL